MAAWSTAVMAVGSLTPLAHRAARARALGPITPATSGGPPAWTGGGPTGSSSSKGGTWSQISRMRATWASMRCQRRVKSPPMAR